MWPLFIDKVFQRGRLTPKQKQLDDLSVATFRKREKLKDDINKIFVNKFEKRPIEIFPDVLIGGSKKCGTIVRVFDLIFFLFWSGSKMNFRITKKKIFFFSMQYLGRIPSSVASILLSILSCLNRTLAARNRVLHGRRRKTINVLKGDALRISNSNSEKNDQKKSGRKFFDRKLIQNS